jgi:hypothetical protein
MMSAPEPPPERRPPATAADAAARIGMIVEAAERAATKVIEDAEEEARRHLDETRERANRIVAEQLRELADQLHPPSRSERAARHLEPVGTSPVPDAQQQVDRRSGAAGARLLATQMAISGAGREEIEARLRDELGLENAGEILDAVLGPGE